ncbi:ferritin-like domain-containing protein [Sphingomonas corticis]|jgi:hypothetical protein|uniref:Ferritin-like domain-containing protein n=1 Tax=Sphingomonas corticis TaxID=2722791 RepID=A0ABX1CQM7_9SPHN|nr:ferritin-like domain-containing protein [Sphingomonas corticis]NJR78625.1 ferritin-like domain-containing protein [Sphingomonas corticis]
MPADEGSVDASKGDAAYRTPRRDFFRHVVGAAAVGAGAVAFARDAAAQGAPTDLDILNFALNLEYLEAQFYAFAANGTGLAADQLTGTQTPGAVTGARRANLVDREVIQYVREIASDEAAHVATLRRALGSAAVAQPAIDLSPTVFTAVAQAADIDLSSSGGVFDPYASDENFLLAAYIFEDVGVTAYKGAAALLSGADVIDAAAGLLAAEAFHAGLIRSALYRRGATVPELREKTNQISDARDDLDGDDASDGPPQRNGDSDQGVSPITSIYGTAANIVPTDSRSIVFGRNTEQVHNIVYLTREQVTAGGFFPAGTNNPNPALRRSGAN